MRRTDLILVPSELERTSLDGRQIVIVDVLRACSTIAHALRNGAAKIIPVETVEEATRLHETLDPRASLLCGEREGRKVGGFDLGNSPREYTHDRVAGATLVFASTNASPLMARTLGGREQTLLSYVNVGAVVAAVQEGEEDLAVVCAGRNGRFSLEDAACAGAFLHRLATASPAIELSDAASVAVDYHREHGRAPEEILRRSEHGRCLIELGFEEDLPICAAVDSVPIAPLLRDGRIAAPPPGD